KPKPSTVTTPPASMRTLRSTATSRYVAVFRQVKQPPALTKRLLRTRGGAGRKMFVGGKYTIAPPLTVRSKGDREGRGVFVPELPPLSTSICPVMALLALV